MGELFRDERLARLYAYWHAKRVGKTAPRRTDLDFADMADLLPIINLLEVEREPLGFRHRLVGAELVERLGRNARGRLVDEALYGPAAAEIFATLERLTSEIRPFRRRARLDWNGRSWLTLEAVELPLIDEDGRVDMILRGSSFSTPGQVPEQRLEYAPLPDP
jgi:hypothetical protein